ncbi:MAG: hypothetical protein HS104_31570 [Polyangiaceae bacterium]|nr:hypothetical protein [Polyangiaceae bacterium]
MRGGWDSGGSAAIGSVLGPAASGSLCGGGDAIGSVEGTGSGTVLITGLGLGALGTFGGAGKDPGAVPPGWGGGGWESEASAGALLTT